MFGNQVDVAYYDVASPEVQARFTGVLDTASARYWPHPLVLIGERVVMAGDVDAYTLARLIEQELN